MLKLKICQIENALGIALSREALERLHVQEGDMVYLSEESDGSYRLTPYEPDFEKKMQKADEIMHRYRNTLRSLAE